MTPFYRLFNAEVGRRSIGKLLSRLAIRLLHEFVLGQCGIPGSKLLPLVKTKDGAESFEEVDHSNAYGAALAPVTTFGMAVVILGNPFWR